MTDMRFSVCSRRSVIKCIHRITLPLFHAFLEDIMIRPEFFYFFFTLYKIHVSRYFLVHVFSSFLLDSFFDAFVDSFVFHSLKQS